MLTTPIIFLFYKKNLNLIYIILCLFVLFSSFRVVLFVFLDQNKNFTTLELTDSYSDSDICKKEREEVNMQCDSLVEMIDNINIK